MVCVYCYRGACEGCPLRFDDKITLRNLIETAQVPTQPTFLYKNTEEPVVDSTAKPSAEKDNKKKSKHKKASKAKTRSSKDSEETKLKQDTL